MAATMRSACTVFGVVLVLVGSLPPPGAAQELRPAVFVAAGVANLYRAEDRSFGTEPNVGAGVGLEFGRFGFDVELHRTLGLTPRAVQCATGGVPCLGSAREGFLAATMLSGNVSYSFGSGRVRPYVTGSVGVLWTRSVNSLTVGTGTATLTEFDERDAGLAIGVGLGVDIPLTASLSMRPEFRTYSSVAMSRQNVGVHRGAVAIRYRW
jgi:opacity protein-like surface antigen